MSQAGTHAIGPYLTFNGNCEEAMRFYAQALGVPLGELHRFADAPADAGPSPGPDWGQKVMHANFTWHGQRLMASDGFPGQPHAGFSGFALSLNVSTEAEAEQCFAALSAQGQVTMPLAATFWARRFGMFTDRFGVPWMINCE